VLTASVARHRAAEGLDPHSRSVRSALRNGSEFENV